MSARVNYEYAIIRLVPLVEREEFINIGVILYSKEKSFLDLQYALPEKRILSLWPATNLDVIQCHLDAWDQVAAGNPDGGEIGKMDMAMRFRWLVASRSTIIQCSPTHPGLCMNPEEELKNLFHRYVTS